MKYHVLAMLCLAAMIAYIQRLAFSVCEQQIRVDLVLDKPRIGEIMAAWQLGYALLQLPSGWLADRIGSRLSLTIFITTWSGLMGIATLCTDYWSLLLVWGSMGMAQAGVFPCATKLIGEWFGATRRASASGFLASSMALGIALAPLLTTQLQGVGWNWTSIFLLYVVPGWLWAAVFIATTRTRVVPVETADSKSEGRNQESESLVRLSWGDYLSNVSLWYLCGQQFFRAAAMMFFQNWFPTFLRETRGVDVVASGKLAFVVGLGALLGGMCGGLFSDWLLVKTGNRRLSRQGIAIFGMLTCGCLIGISYFVTDIHVAIGCISLGAFLATFGGISGYTMAIEFGGRHVATTFSLMNMCGNIGAAIFPLLVGYIAVTQFGWDGVLFLSVIILFIDAFCWAMLNPKSTISGERLTHAKT
jgi:sugar phosphate permease